MGDQAMKRILVVEDEQSIGNMCKRILNKEGFDVDIAVNGRLAQDMVKKTQYNVCVIDIRTPKINGAELYQWLVKNYPPVANCVIFTTGSLIDEQTMTFIEQSGRPFLPKPFNPDELTAIVKESIK
jgi:DNA-binding response OmpR family regulator